MFLVEADIYIFLVHCDVMDGFIGIHLVFVCLATILPVEKEVFDLTFHFFNALYCRDGQCPEYSGEEQAICAVGLAKSKPGVFVEAIQYLLVLATPVEVFQFPYVIPSFHLCNILHFPLF